MNKLPKRKKSKDNPYTILYDEMKNQYKLRFIDSQKKCRIVDLTNELYALFNQFELEDISQMHKYDKHIEHSEIYEESLFKRALSDSIQLEEFIERKIEISSLKSSLEKLPEAQKRRIKKYYFDEKSLEEISSEENCSFQAISKSILLGLKNLRKNIKK